MRHLLVTDGSSRDRVHDIVCIWKKVFFQKHQLTSDYFNRPSVFRSTNGTKYESG